MSDRVVDVLKMDVGCLCVVLMNMYEELMSLMQDVS
jgi:hypothetical protein